MTEDRLSTGTRSNVESAETTRLVLRLCPSASRGFALVISYYTIAACLGGAYARVHLHASAVLTHVYLSPIGCDRIFFQGNLCRSARENSRRVIIPRAAGTFLCNVMIGYRNLSRAITSRLGRYSAHPEIFYL